MADNEIRKEPASAAGRSRREKMGVYLNPGSGGFEEAVRSEIYVDKTEMIAYLNTVLKTRQKYVSVSRPRRFGKTTAADMLCAYYGRGADSRTLFEKMKLSHMPSQITVAGEFSWDQYLGVFDVIRVVMTDFMDGIHSVSELLEYLTDEVTDELMETYPDVHYGKRINVQTVMKKIYADTGRPFVVVIDEWDAVFRTWKNDRDGQTEYLNFLRNWLKDKEYVALAYMTGILPIKKYGEHSALNMFDEYSMVAPMQLASFTGFTDEEVRALCSKYGRAYPKIKDWYDGYLVSDIIPPDPAHPQEYDESALARAHSYQLYSPLSVVKAVTTGHIMNYWNNTESYEALAEYIRRDYDGLQSTVALLMDGGRVKVNLSTYQNDMTTFHNKDDVLALLIHLGYLGYDSTAGEVFVPNKEILDVFRASTQSEKWTSVFRAYEISQKLLRATWAMDEKKVTELLEKAHDAAANQTYNSEAALSYAIQLAYYAAEKYYTKILELDTGKGYADIVYLPSPRYPDKPVLLIELKYGRTAETALDQIKKREYPERLAHYKGSILLVAINYEKNLDSTDPEYKRHKCIIERA